MAETRLQTILADVRRRLLGISLGGGLAWALVAAVLLLVACAWLDLALDLPPATRVACLLAAGLLAVALLAWAAVSALRQGHGVALARRLDRVGNTGGQILAGVDLARQFAVASPAGRPGSAAAAVVQQPTSAALARIAIDRAAALAGGVRAAAAVPLKPLYWPLVGVAVVAIGLLTVALSVPRMAMTQWLRFSDPFGDHPPYSAIEFDVSPGDAKVLYGSVLDVRATPVGGPVEQLDLVLLPAGSAGAAAGAAGEQVLPMFPEPGGSWRATVAEVTSAGRYLVRTRGSRSKQFGYDVVTVPEIRDVRFRVTPPAYTRKPPYEGPLPQGGIAGLPGTLVEAWVKSNRPLAGGPARFVPAPDAGAVTVPTTAPSGSSTTGTDARPTARGFDAASGSAKETVAPVASAAPAAVGSPAVAASATGTDGAAKLTLSPVAPNASEAKVSFAIAKPGKLELGVTDVAGQTSRETFSAPVHLLRDDRPFARIMEPRPQSYATPDVTLNVQVLAEDDYGVSRVQVFRSLNDSRPRAVDAPVPPTQPKRLPVAVPLKLGEYGLKPGDVVKLFARVEDTDPAGPKGSESAVVSVQIVSRDEMNRMAMARQGLETLQSKYDQARRRLEQLDNEIRKAQDDLGKSPPESELAKEAQAKLDELAKQVDETADDIAKIAGDDLPLDVDRKLRQSLFDLAADVRTAGMEFFHDAGQLGLTGAQAKKATDELRKKLGLGGKKFDQEATEPLEHLSKIFPLKEDEARFTDLAMRQRDLAERMAALQGQAGDDPKKARLRDLEQEQRHLKDELRDLLQDIDSHVAALPADPKLDGLRKQASEFAKAVRASEADRQMNAAETALSEFQGGEAAEQAKAAADTLEKFVGRCKGMGEQASECLGFQPKLSDALGNTVDQLLDMEGLGSNPGKGMGNGAGYSARRNTLRNVGLYGSRPMSSRPGKSKGGQGDPAAADRSGGSTPDDPDAGDADGGGKVKAAGANDAAVPPRYKRKVGEYFQRVADELGEN